jgi:hypothetical protein
LEAVEDEVDSVSFYEVEKNFENILQKWSDCFASDPIADKWKCIDTRTWNTSNNQKIKKFQSIPFQ